jgi:hypothetical protein
MGYQGLEEENVTRDPTPAGTPPHGTQVAALMNACGKPMRDPLWSFTKEEMIRLCRVYEEEMGLMYPVVNIEEVILHGRTRKKSLTSLPFSDMILTWGNCQHISCLLICPLSHHSLLSPTLLVHASADFCI